MLENDENTAEKGALRGPGEYPRRRFSASASRFGRLCLKELRETLRDRRTIVTLVLMPLLVYPLLTMAFQRFSVTSLDTTREFIIGLNSEAAALRAQHYLDKGKKLLAPEDASGDGGGTSKEMPNRATDSTPSVRWVTGPDLEQGVAESELDLAIMLDNSQQDGSPANESDSFRCELVYRTGSATSKAALEFVTERFRAVNENALKSQLEEAGEQAKLPTQISSRAVGDSGAMLSVTTLIPLVLILMTITGAVYPAIDLTAGERERGTLEALMAAPVPRLGLLAGKYVAVLTVALLTAGANLVAMTVTLASTGLGTILFGPAGLSPLVLIQVFALLILFAAFFSAILLAVTSFARSFKEAQAYLIPLMLLSLAPGMLTLMPGLKLSGPLAVTPLVNIVLLARDVFEGTADPGLAAVAVLSTALYAVAAIALAAKVFGADALLYGSEASWSDLLHRPAKRRDAASIAAAMLCVVALFPCCFILSSLVARQEQLSMQARLLLHGSATVALFVGLPLAAAIVQRVRIKDGFQLRAAGPLGFVAAVLLGLATWPLAYEVYLLNELMGLAAVGERYVRIVERMLEQWRDVSPLVILLALAVIQPVCEELFFRGYLFRAIVRASSASRAILASAVLFGAFHVVATSLLVGRFLPSTFLGLMLGWVCWRTGSVLPGMLLHVCHNGLLLMIAYYRDELAARGWGVEEQSHMPFTWLAASTVGIAVGVAIIMLMGRTNRPNKNRETIP